MQVQLIQAVCKKLQKSKSSAVIAEELEEELPEIEKIINAQQQAGNYDVEKIYSILTSRNEIWISS